ncbi:YfiT family bacillithiol transferase [Alkalicoccus daliensis]|uniref:Putative metal-dependent hydrolase SAMN04488053_108116 n=1 Tax=Alkalicoccus daliensis TaxID=745820 RepID=A0A1H0HIB3_9BACI|nr:bacillithiol transferase BstA [Alkalicoccus daliensis]SDO18918.1 Uncharacterized damage-inducible protein DinB (forms a four-helix bundle) [Alkalicoccus daliensis]
MEKLQYPIGRFTQAGYTDDEINAWIMEIEEIPGQLKEAVGELSDEQLDTPYRPGGWTVRQTVHHIADSHMNSYIRFKLALTEDAPRIKPYEEAKWAELSDSELPVDVSLALLESLHSRWTALLWSLREADLEKTFRHPADGEVSLGIAIGLYSWHGRHHIAQITSLKERENWQKSSDI